MNKRIPDARVFADLDSIEPGIDFAEIEVQTALERGLWVVPVLIDGARPLRQEELPPELSNLARLNAFELSYGWYKEDVDRLLNHLREILAEGPDVGPSAVAGSSAPKSQVQVPQLHRPKIFLCYRREDTQGFARGIYESLANKYGREQIFRDIDSTPAGVRYSTWIESRVSQCTRLSRLCGEVFPGQAAGLRRVP